MKQLVIAIFVSCLTATYWGAVFLVAYADMFFAGDRDPSRPPPPSGDVMAHTLTTLIVGVVIYALLGFGWQRVGARYKR